MKLNGRWFPQIVDRVSGNLYPIYPFFLEINTFSFHVFFAFNVFLESFFWRGVSRMSL